MVPRIDIFPTENDFEIAAAQVVGATIKTALRERNECLIALSGGSTPRGVYRRLGDLLATQSVDLSRVYFILVDERMVSPLDPESNYGMVQRELLTRIVLPPGHIHHIRGEASPETAAHEYEQVLETLFSMFNGRCDLIVLGVGKDGHTASLFPGTRVLRELQHNVQAVLVPHLDSWRVTLTLPVINRSRTVLFLVAGEHKAEIVGRIFASMQSRETIPATLVRPDSGTITWILDAKAAARIPRERLSRKS